MTKVNNHLTQTEADLLHHPENFVFPHPSYKEQTRAILKEFYDQQQEKFSLNPQASELLVNGFDTEQIWAQLKPLNSSLLKFLKHKFKELKKYPPTFLTKTTEDQDESLQEDDEEEDVNDEEGSDIEEDQDLEQPEIQEEDEEDEEDGEDEDEDEDLEGEEEEEGKEEEEDEEVEEVEIGDEKTKGGKATKKKDRFFSLEEMNNFINQAEDDEQLLQEGAFRLDQFDEEADEDDDDDDDDDEDEDGDGDDDEDDEKKGEDEDEEEEEDEEGSARKKPDDLFDFHSFSKSVNAQAPPFEDEENEDPEPKTPHQERLSRLQKKIQALEAENIAPKPWTLSGEVTSKERPTASLLEVAVDYDNNQKKPIIITQDVTQHIENVIKERIKQRNWDDVVRKIPEKPKLKKKFELDQEKSKLSLAEIYEKKFLKEIHGVDKEEEKLDNEQKRVQAQFKILMKKLDALSNFVYTPIVEDVSVVPKTNAPSISLEEALPVAVSNASTLAPEQVVKKNIRPTKGLLEISKDDRKKERRRKKRSIKKSQTEEKLKLIAKKRANPNFISKKEVASALEKKNVTIADTKKLRKDFTQSSTMFDSLNQPANKNSRNDAPTSEIANFKY